MAPKMPKAPPPTLTFPSGWQGWQQQQGGAAVAAPQQARPRSLQLSRSEPTLNNRQNSTTSLISLPDLPDEDIDSGGIWASENFQGGVWAEGDALTMATHEESGMGAAGSSTDVVSMLERLHHTSSEEEDEPDEADEEEPTGFDRFERRRDVGNIGVYLANWGASPATPSVRTMMDAMLKRNPCQILVMNEADERTKSMLREPARVDPPQAQDAGAQEMNDAEIAKFYSRDESQWALATTNEAKGATIIAVKVQNSRDPPFKELVNQIHVDGQYTDKGRKTAITRILIARLHLKRHVAFLGKDIMVMGIHMHHKTAGYGAGLRQGHKALWDLCAGYIRRYGVQIMAGDWNKSLLKVNSEFRSRGIRIQTAAWYPWSAGPRDLPHADSCAIHVVNTVVEARLCVEPSMIIHNDDVDQTWTMSKRDNADDAETVRPFPKWPLQTGPGMLIKSYLPPLGTLHEKMDMLLTPQFGTSAELLTAATAEAQLAGTAVADSSYGKWLVTKEKRLMHNVWAINGQFYQGSHFPLCFFTNSKGLRSETAWTHRKDKAQLKRKDNKGEGKGQRNRQQRWQQRGWQQRDQQTGAAESGENGEAASGSYHGRNGSWPEWRPATPTPGPEMSWSSARWPPSSGSSASSTWQSQPSRGTYPLSGYWTGDWWQQIGQDGNWSQG